MSSSMPSSFEPNSSSSLRHDHIWKVLDVPPGSLKESDYSPVVFFVPKVVAKDPPSSSTAAPLQPSGADSLDTFSVVSLTDVVRKYTGGRLGTLASQPGVTVLQVEMTTLYDILGMLRSLQYDLTLSCSNESFAAEASAPNNAAADEATAPVVTASNSIETTAATIQYRRFRLNQQIMACKNVNTFSYASTATNATATKCPVVEGLDELVEFIEATFADRVQLARDLLQEQQLVDFDALAEYCRPGTILLDVGLLSGVTAVPTAVRCRACRYRRSKTSFGNIVSTFEAAVECVVAMGHDGTGEEGEQPGNDNKTTTTCSNYAVVEAQWSVCEFEGTRSIRMNTSDANASTILLQPTDDLLQQLTERGRAYQSYCSSPTESGSSGTLVEYHADTFWPCRSSTSTSNSSSSAANRALRTGGRMMVDPMEAWSRGIHACKPPADGMAADAILQVLQSYARYRRQVQQSSRNNSGATKETSKNATTTANNGPDDFLLLPSLPDCLVALTWPVVCGFSLSSRVWGVALVDGLSAIQFVSSSFDALVLPAPRKRLLRALVTCHGRQQSSASADVMPGKGEGLIMLLHGPPGCGKTLTAEAVAEVLHRPLYRVSMGELGTTPERLEERLQEIFDLCWPWRALILLDEAEMLLEKRQTSSSGGADLVRNAMVCVMLRLLEYYPGILFLTTNSAVDSLDPAVASRITCSLHYEPLNEDGRREIWRASIERVTAFNANDTSATATSKSLLTDADLSTLAATYATVNGRQIKNAVQLATIVRQHEGLPGLTMNLLRETLELTASI